MSALNHLHKIVKWWHYNFLAERPSIGLSFFRIFVALTTIFHVVPTFIHLSDTYYPGAFKTYNFHFFTPQVISFIQQSPVWMIQVWVAIFCIFGFLFLIGLWSQVSCILMTLACYYFYALNSFHVGTLSFDILLVTLFLMCLTPYHGDYFSMDCLLRGDEKSYRRPRPMFIQSLLQMQIGFTYFYTALYKITASGNWLKEPVILYLMKTPHEGVTKPFLFRDYFANHSELCYWIGVFIVIVELAMLFLLCCPKTRRSAIYLGFIFHITLILTLDVPAIFFFLFPAQLLLFIPPESVVAWIENKKADHAYAKRPILIFDGQCQFCLGSVRIIKIMDLFGILNYVDLHHVDVSNLHHQLNQDVAMSQINLVTTDGVLRGGYEAVRWISLRLPMFFPVAFILYFPGMGCLGPLIYKFIAKNRYLFHFQQTCRDNSCFRKS